MKKLEYFDILIEHLYRYSGKISRDKNNEFMCESDGS